jgi:cell shape-determining protein MreC
MSNYLQQRNILRHRLRSRLSVVVVTITILGTVYFIAPDFWGGILREAVRPLWIARSTLALQFSEYTDLLKSKSSLIEENSALRDRLDRSTLTLLDRSLLRQENAKLLALLGRTESRSSVIARVLATPRQSPYDTLVLDIGSNSKIEEGDIVFVAGEIPIGYISMVKDRSALVTLYSSPDEEVSAFLGTSATPVVLHGRGGGNFLLTLPRDNDNSKGDIAVLAKYPTDVLAIVESVETEISNPFATLRLRSPVNIYNITFVEVINSTL